MAEEQKIILVIEDDASIRELVTWNLAEDGYGCLCANDGMEGLTAVREEAPDLIILDLMLPRMDGFEVIKTLRMEGVETPVIMLTAKNEEADKVIGLEFGADDYITKPFGIRELKARIKAVLRRYKTDEPAYQGDGTFDRQHPREGDVAQEAGLYRIEGLEIDVPRHEVRADGLTVALTFKEFELLKTLAENRGRVLTREQLLDVVWGYEYLGETRTVDVHIRYIRRKLGEAGTCITTVRGLGYKMQ